jgi:hypothetical protein
MHALVSINILVPLGATNGLFITLLDKVLRKIWKQFEKCQTIDFPILALLFDPKKEASRWKLAWQSCYAASQLNLQYN